MFVSGNPGGTDRQMTVAQLETQRDTALPDRPHPALRAARPAAPLLGGRARAEAHRHRPAVRPRRTASRSSSAGCSRSNDKTFMDARRAAEADLRAGSPPTPKLAAEIADPWGEIAGAQAAYADQYLHYRQLEASAGSLSDLFGYARDLVRAAQERAKPSAERLPEYAGNPPALLLREELLDAKPVDAPLEQLLPGILAVQDARVPDRRRSGEQVAAGQGQPGRPVGAAGERDPAGGSGGAQGLVGRRRRGRAGLDRSDDPVRSEDGPRRARGAQALGNGGSPARPDRAAERLARARFAAYGDAVYPDATFTPATVLRQGRGLDLPRRDRALFHDTFAGLLRPRHRRRAVRPDAPLDCGEGQAQSGHRLRLRHHQTTSSAAIPARPWSTPRARCWARPSTATSIRWAATTATTGRSTARTVVVSTAAATEALDKVYGQAALLKELTGK